MPSSCHCNDSGSRMVPISAAIFSNQFRSRVARVTCAPGVDGQRAVFSRECGVGSPDVIGWIPSDERLALAEFEGLALHRSDDGNETRIEIGRGHSSERFNRAECKDYTRDWNVGGTMG